MTLPAKKNSSRLYFRVVFATVVWGLLSLHEAPGGGLAGLNEKLPGAVKEIATHA